MTALFMKQYRIYCILLHEFSVKIMKNRRLNHLLTFQRLTSIAVLATKSIKLHGDL